MTPENDKDGIRLTEEQKKRRRQRNWAIAAVLIALVLIFYIMTIFNFGPGVLNRPL